MSKPTRVQVHFVAGYNKHGHRLWGPVPVNDAPNATVAKMYANAALRRLPHGEALNATCTQIVAVRRHRDTPSRRLIELCDQLVKEA